MWNFKMFFSRPLFTIIFNLKMVISRLKILVTYSSRSRWCASHIAEKTFDPKVSYCSNSSFCIRPSNLISPRLKLYNQYFQITQYDRYILEVMRGLKSSLFTLFLTHISAQINEIAFFYSLLLLSNQQN